MSERVTLTLSEVLMATAAGAVRHMEAVRAGRRDRHGFEGDGLSAHILGACGEIAVGKLTGMYWGGESGTFKKSDIGHDVQIKTRSLEWHDLIVRHDDADDHRFVLVTGSPPCLTVHGWVWGREAKQPGYLKPHGGRPEAYFVPQSALRAMRVRAEVAA